MSPAIILVHGAFTDGSIWRDVIGRLQARGSPVTAVQLPLTSLAEDVASTRVVIARQDRPVILVGHSWGGAVVTEAGNDERVQALVYIAALAPDAGESVADLQRHGPPPPGMEGARPDDRGFLWFDPDHYGNGLAGDLPPELVAVLAATQKPIALRSFGEKLTGAAWRNKPSFYLLSENDRALTPELQTFLAARMKAQTLTVAASHMSPVSQADAVVALIEQAAQLSCSQ
ncbi:alpha/beta fold hydrolase [Aestuariivirga sp.]|uniref:alpha/beta fold hydrolase n=1 Tax=Aestuariivirga sp. TaxID=2650926 RepID=UPI0039E25DE9